MAIVVKLILNVIIIYFGNDLTKTIVFVQNMTSDKIFRLISHEKLHRVYIFYRPKDQFCNCFNDFFLLVNNASTAREYFFQMRLSLTMVMNDEEMHSKLKGTVK